MANSFLVQLYFNRFRYLILFHAIRNHPCNITGEGLINFKTCIRMEYLEWALVGLATSSRVPHCTRQCSVITHPFDNSYIWSRGKQPQIAVIKRVRVHIQSKAGVFDSSCELTMPSRCIS